MAWLEVLVGTALDTYKSRGFCTSINKYEISFKKAHTRPPIGRVWAFVYLIPTMGRQPALPAIFSANSYEQ